MEATGVGSIPVYYVLEEAFSMVLVNPAEVERLPRDARPTWPTARGWRSCWSIELLRSSFVPPPAIRELRNLVRYRSSLKGDHGPGSPIGCARVTVPGRRPQALQCDERRP